MQNLQTHSTFLRALNLNLQDDLQRFDILRRKLDGLLVAELRKKPGKS
jgi:hypothetical protein